MITRPSSVPSPDEKGRRLGVGLATPPCKEYDTLTKQQLKLKLNKIGTNASVQLP